MPPERLLLDTFFVLALLNKNDQHHEKAKEIYPRELAALEVWVTEAVLVEIANGLSAVQHRKTAATFIDSCYAVQNFRIVNVSSELLQRALDLYKKRDDKNWSLTDCISFVVMDENDLMDAVTGDRDFQQAGYTALML